MVSEPIFPQDQVGAKIQWKNLTNLSISGGWIIGLKAFNETDWTHSDSSGQWFDLGPGQSGEATPLITVPDKWGPDVNIDMYVWLFAIEDSQGNRLADINRPVWGPASQEPWWQVGGSAVFKIAVPQDIVEIVSVTPYIV